MSKTTLALPFALALVVSALACAPEVPAAPTYTKDVQPILAAHCVRCHNETLTVDPISGEAPTLCHLNRFEDAGDCSAAGMTAGLCLRGASASICALMFPTKITAPDNARMPPPPSDRLNDWEQDVLKRWAAAPTK